MPLPTFNPPVGPSPGTDFQPEISLYEADFGDGYSQPTPKGSNHIRQTVTLSWNALTLAQKNYIESFLTERAGNKPFYYKPAGIAQPLKWTCKEWDYRLDGNWQVRAKFTQTFALGA